MQIKKLHPEINKLHLRHGAKNLAPIYGAGCVKNPKAMFIFMNPTGKNISSVLDWNGIRAPWLGTKNIWKIFYDLNLLSDEIYNSILKFNSNDWTETFSKRLYGELSKNRVYITNLAKCTQVDARPLSNSVFKDYLQNTKEEIFKIKPQNIITFGNQASSVLLSKNIKVSDYKNKKSEELKIKNSSFKVFPVYYPVGQGQRNMSLAVERIKCILNQ